MTPNTNVKDTPYWTLCRKQYIDMVPFSVTLSDPNLDFKVTLAYSSTSNNSKMVKDSSDTCIEILG